MAPPDLEIRSADLSDAMVNAQKQPITSLYSFHGVEAIVCFGLAAA